MAMHENLQPGQAISGPNNDALIRSDRRATFCAKLELFRREVQKETYFLSVTPPRKRAKMAKPERKMKKNERVKGRRKT
jgi:hypothetical protein